MLYFIVIIIAVAVRWDHANSCWDMETGNWTYTHTIRRPEINNERPELKMQISAREYKVGRERDGGKVSWITLCIKGVGCSALLGVKCGGVALQENLGQV